MEHLVSVFWVSLTLGMYPYVGYPVLVWLLSRFAARSVRKDLRHTPTICIIIAAHNEARAIEATVLNKLDQNYPEELVEILVVSDGSTDGTDEILRRISATVGRVRLIRQDPRQGKTAALNLAVSHSVSDVVVFSDANSIYRPDTLQHLAANFADSTVGYVTGKMLYGNPDGSLVGDGCTAYMKYEHALWAWETRLGSNVGVDGGVDAIRRTLYRPMRADQLPDFTLSLDVIEQGYRSVFEPRAIVLEEALNSEDAEQRMRVRVALRGLWAIWDKRRLLNLLSQPLFSWQLTSHKLLRYLSAAPLFVAAIVNWFLLDCGTFYVAFAIGQFMFFLLAGARALNIDGLANTALARYCLYFLILNWASAKAAVYFVLGRKMVVWQPRTG